MASSKRSDIALLILAAGESKRMGQAKQLLPWGETTLLGQALEQALKTPITRKYLLLGARAEHIMQEVDLTGFIPLINPDWEEGMGTGIAFATHKILNDLPDLNGVLIMLADQPEVNSDLLTTMLDQFDASEKPVLACAYEKKAGVPAIISGVHMEQLTTFQGDTGARKLFKTIADQLELFELNESLQDIDDPETYRRLHDEYFKAKP